MENGLRILKSGSTFTVCALVRGGRCQVTGFLDEMKRANATAYKRLMTAIEILADRGTRDLPSQVFRSLGEGCFELKERGGLARLFCFVDSSRNAVVVCRNGWQKKAGSAQDAQIQELRKCRKTYLESPAEFEE